MHYRELLQSLVALAESCHRELRFTLIPKLMKRRIEKPDFHIVAARKLLLRHYAGPCTEVPIRVTMYLNGFLKTEKGEKKKRRKEVGR